MALIQCLVLFTFIEVRTVKFFPHAESWLVEWNFRGASRMQGAGHVLYTHAITTRVHTTQMCTCCIPVHTFFMPVAKTNQPEHCCDKMRVAFARTWVCMQDMIRAHAKMKCKEKNGTFHVYCLHEFPCNQCVRRWRHDITIFSPVNSCGVLVTMQKISIFFFCGFQ